MTMLGNNNTTILGPKMAIYLSAKEVFKSKLILVNNSFNRLPCSISQGDLRLGVIKDITSRIKSDDSIKGKLKKHKVTYTYENAVEICKDIIGFRIVCMYEKDIYTIVKLIKQLGLNIVREKDYIKTPKESGYRSYHMTIELPIELPTGEVENVYIEIQIRTDFMDLWASREHEMKYKSKISKKGVLGISQALIDLSGSINVSQVAMENAREKQLEIIEDKKINKVFKNEQLEIIDPELVQSAERIVGSRLVLAKNMFDMLECSTNLTNSRLGDIKDILDRNEINKYVNKDNVGFRIICMYEKDIYTIVELIKKSFNNSGINIVCEKDYVTTPKESGYRSYHMAVEVPISINQNVRVKIQIRTDFMDLWASREFEMKYKSILSDEELSTIGPALKDLSGSIHISQVAMENARKQELELQNIECDSKVLKKV